MLTDKNSDPIDLKDLCSFQKFRQRPKSLSEFLPQTIFSKGNFSRKSKKQRKLFLMRITKCHKIYYGKILMPKF